MSGFIDARFIVIIVYSGSWFLLLLNSDASYLRSLHIIDIGRSQWYRSLISTCSLKRCGLPNQLAGRIPSATAPILLTSTTVLHSRSWPETERLVAWLKQHIPGIGIVLYTLSTEHNGSCFSSFSTARWTYQLTPTLSWGPPHSHLLSRHVGVTQHKWHKRQYENHQNMGHHKEKTTYEIRLAHHHKQSLEKSSSSGVLSSQVGMKRTRLKLKHSKL